MNALRAVAIAMRASRICALGSADSVPATLLQRRRRICDGCEPSGALPRPCASIGSVNDAAAGGAILAIDQGSSSTRCVVTDGALRTLAAASAPVKTSRPGPGMVEHDPGEVFEGVRRSIGEALEAAGSPDVAAVGIATQTEAFLL